MKRITLLVSLLLILCLVLVGCGQTNETTGPSTTQQNIPTINLGYIFTNHQTPLLVSAAKGEAFKDMGVYLKPVVAKEKYELISNGKTLANINLVVTKSGSEVTTLMAQKHIDIALGSVTAFMHGVDQQTPMKVLCPIQTEGMGLVVPQDSNIQDWDTFVAYLKATKQPVKIGYHSPTSGPKIVFEGALKKANISVTQDPNNMQAEVLLVDLKSTSNLNPALTSKQVDGWVGPSPYPEVAVTEGIGKIAFELRDLPPEGYWHDFPCCVVGARQEIIDNNPEVTQAFVEVTHKASDWCNANKEEAATITAEWIGIPVEAAKVSNIIYTTNPTAKWKEGIATYIDILNEMNKFNNNFKGKKYSEIETSLMDFSFIEKVSQ